MADVGRPTLYQASFAKQAEKLCLLGATDEQLAEFFEVCSKTIQRWSAQHPEFCLALKDGKTAADQRVERSLYHRAVGYTYDAVKIFMTKEGEPLYAPYKEHVPPDVTATIFWLKNRQPAKWRDVHKLEHGGVGDFDELSDAELRQRIARATGSRRKNGRGTGSPEDPPSLQ